MWALATDVQDTALKVIQLQCLLKAYLQRRENVKYYVYFMLKQFSYSLEEEISGFRIQNCASDLAEQVLACLAEINLLVAATQSPGFWSQLS